ncbi:MAG: hypothetical protein JSU61_03695 [Fidelibacterota bacterium]|nr:MAG: hypothetical protein JSU61_03695 [Candidatus Neomarinimicrobiota bacterium]
MIRVLLLIVLALIAGGCTQQRLMQSITPSERITPAARDSKYLKAHMRDGQVYIFSRWAVSENGLVEGSGRQLNLERAEVHRGELSVPIDSVVIFESNQVTSNPAIAGLTLITGASLATTMFCLINPKACFGSCPTFYASDGNEMVIQSEGFSSSVLPALEARDIDALYHARAMESPVHIKMTNEALETHVVRSVHLLAVPQEGDDRIFATIDGEFWRAGQTMAPFACLAPEGDCRSSLLMMDGKERFSVTDGRNLAAKEVLELTFEDIPAGRLGLVIGSRQTLLTTFLFYQGLAYLGQKMGSTFADLERNGIQMDHPLGSVGELLGGIEVHIQDDQGEWRVVGVDDETGPIATDVKIMPLPPMTPGRQKLRLRMTKGHVRLDYVALAVMDEQVQPIRLQPMRVEKAGATDEESLHSLMDPAQALVTLPGDSYTLTYELPQTRGSYELFLESQGYYLEWMRDVWLADENLRLARELFRKPEKALRRLAPEYKKIEASMEEVFWSSRYARP